MKCKRQTLYAFVHVPKAAGSTIATILRQSFLTRHCDARCGNAFRGQPRLTARSLSRIRWIYRRLESIQGHGVVPCSDLEKLGAHIRYYVFLRDPAIRCASEYQYRVLRGGLDVPFEEWIQKPIARNRMTKMLAGETDSKSAIRVLNTRIGCVGLQEKFDESLLMLRRWMGDTRLDIRYRAKNVMADNSVKQQLLDGSKTRALLEEANAEDRKLYDYAAGTAYPRQQAAYGSGLARDVEKFRAENRPRPNYPRQLASLMAREMVYKPIALRLSEFPKGYENGQ